jgi:DNA mismatch repair protein MLH3
VHSSVTPTRITSVTPCPAAWLQMYLHQLMETGVASTPPPGVLRVLRSKACRSAIMFGQRLSQPQGVQLLRQLSDTQLFWCCAHGRPTTVPLVDLQQVQVARAAARRRAHAG